MLNPNLTRRRMIVIAATAAGSAFVTGGRTAQAGGPVRWYGSALGAQVSIEIYHPDRVEAKRLVAQCVLDVQRLEQQFSLYRADFRDLRPQPHWYSCLSRRRHGGAAESLAVFC